MKRDPIESSCLIGAGYDPKRRTLEVMFPSGLIYRYHGVPRQKYDRLLRADSPGAYFNAEIKDHYPVTRG